MNLCDSLCNENIVTIGTHAKWQGFAWRMQQYLNKIKSDLMHFNTIFVVDAYDVLGYPHKINEIQIPEGHVMVGSETRLGPEYTDIEAYRKQLPLQTQFQMELSNLKYVNAGVIAGAPLDLVNLYTSLLEWSAKTGIQDDQIALAHYMNGTVSSPKILLDSHNVLVTNHIYENHFLVKHTVSAFDHFPGSVTKKGLSLAYTLAILAIHLLHFKFKKIADFHL
jgi:hypothetical protein